MKKMWKNAFLLVLTGGYLLLFLLLQLFSPEKTLSDSERRALQQKPQLKHSADEKKILACLQTGEKHTEQLMSETGLAPHLLFSALTELEINGVIKALPGSRYQISYQ